MSALTPLLITKLHAPPTRSRLVARPQLIERIGDGIGRRLTLISAPPGFGKTTLLSHWALNSPCPVAWLSLDEDDGDPMRFMTHIVAALQRIAAITSEGVAALITTQQRLSTQSILTALINEIDSSPREFVLVLDDYHLIDSQPVHEVLAYLLDHLPSQIHIVIATRADPPLPLARLRARGQLTELRQSDLRFTPDESAAFLNQVMELGLATEDVTALASRTEGWIAGLQLAATSMQVRGDTHQFIQDFKGSNRYILDYLVEEVFLHQTKNVQTFLLHTSILDRLIGSLCDAVTAQSDGQATLERLERANLFVVPLDDERKWYRYHRLFADLLQKRLGETDPELVPTLHQRASEWHEQHGLLSEAIDHALAAKVWERAAELIERAAEAALRRSESVTLLKWINALPEEQAQARPLLCLYHAWVMLVNGSALEAVEAQLANAGKLSPSFAGQALSVRAFVAQYRGEIAEAIELSRRALEQLPESEMFFRGLAKLNLVTSYHTNGDVQSSLRVLQEAADEKIDNPLMAVNAASYRAEIYRREGQLRLAHTLYKQALDLATDTQHQQLPIAGRPLLGMAEIEREWNELETATRHVTAGIELVQQWADMATFSGYLTLARIGQAKKDWHSVLTTLAKMRQIALAFKASETDDRLVDIIESWMQIAQGKLTFAHHWAAQRGYTGQIDLAALEAGDNAATRHLRKYEIPVVARLWLAEGRPAEAVPLLETALPRAEQTKRPGLIIEYQILIAIAARALGWKEKSLQAMECALLLGAPEGYVRAFVDEGKAVQSLIADFRAQLEKQIRHAPDQSQDHLRNYTARLLSAFDPQVTHKPAPATHGDLVEPLSAREIEVLCLVADGLSNEEIAQRLTLSLPTIKWHTSNIYSKLSVKNRTEAVAKARTLGVLPIA